MDKDEIRTLVESLAEAEPTRRDLTWLRMLLTILALVVILAIHGEIGESNLTYFSLAANVILVMTALNFGTYKLERK